MILYIEDSKDATRKLLELINEFSEVAGYKINIQKSVAFLYSSNELPEINYRQKNIKTTNTWRLNTTLLNKDRKSVV